MQLPSQAQVNTFGRYAGTIAGTAFAIFGLQAKGISLDQVKAIIQACGTVVNDFVVLIGLLLPFYTTLKGFFSSSPTGQAASIGANAKTVVEPAPGGGAIVKISDPAMASAALAADKASA